MAKITSRKPLSDIEITDLEKLSQYNIYVNNGNYTYATMHLNEKKVNKGIRASILNAIKKSIIDLEVYILNLYAGSETIVSLTEPELTTAKKYWIQPTVKENEMSILSDALKCIKHIKKDNGWQKISEWTLAESVDCKDGENMQIKIDNLTQSVSKIKSGSSLPPDAASHPDTLYLITE